MVALFLFKNKKMKRIREQDHELCQLSQQLQRNISEELKIITSAYTRGRRIVATFEDAERLGLHTLFPHGTVFQRILYFAAHNVTRRNWKVHHLLQNSTINEYFHDHCHVIQYDPDMVLRKCQEALDADRLCIAYNEDDRESGICSTPFSIGKPKDRRLIELQ
jgi:hypothetical protein